MKKAIVLFLTSAMLFSCAACTQNGGQDATTTPLATMQAGVANGTESPMLGLNNTLEPAETFYLPAPTALVEVTSAPQGQDAPFEKGQYVANFYKTTDKGQFSAPGYMGYTIANSKADIEAYIAKFESMMDFDEEFKPAMEKYDDAYFTNKALIFVMHEEAEGQGRGKVESVEQFEDYVCITLTCDTPWASYDDPNSVPKVRYQCVIEMNKDDIINNDVTVFEFQ